MIENNENELPLTYKPIVLKIYNRFLKEDFLEDKEIYEKEMYNVKILILEMNNLLQKLHDVIEGKALRGEFLTETEVEFLHEMTCLYDVLIYEILPKVEHIGGTSPIELEPMEKQDVRILTIEDIQRESSEKERILKRTYMDESADSTCSNTDPVSPKEESETFDILVTVKRVEDLRPSLKNRPDHPFFYVGMGNPEHYMQDRMDRFKSASIKKTKNPEFNQTFTLKVKPYSELLVDIRFYSRVSGVRNDFPYGVINIPLNELLLDKGKNVQEEINAWFDIFTANGKQGRAHVCIELVKAKIPDWITQFRPFYVPEMSSYDQFYIHERNQVIYSGPEKTSLGFIKIHNNSLLLIDSNTKSKIYSMEKYSFLRKEYAIRNEKNHIIAKCFHKMKTFRKKKIRMNLGTGEHLYSMEGGCFDNKTTDNEVLMFNMCNRPVASLVFVGKEVDISLILSILDPLADRPLILMFAYYVLKTCR